MRADLWSKNDDDMLTSLYISHSAGQIAKRLGRSRASIKNRAAKLGLKKSCNPGRFSLGQTPWNAGSHYVAGGRSSETRFKTGHRPHTWNPIGHERVSKDGYLQRKLTDTGVTRRDYVFVHRLIWRWHDKTVPAGHALIFKDGNKRNFDINNLEVIPRAELMRRNSVHNYPKEIAQLVQLRGAINRKINARERNAA